MTLTINADGLNVGSVPAMSRPSMLLNGTFSIDQRHEGAAATLPNTGESVWQTDGWVGLSIASAVMTLERSTDAPPGFSHSNKLTIVNGAAVSDPPDFVELYSPVYVDDMSALKMGTAGALPSAVTIIVKSSVAAHMSVLIQQPDSTREFTHDINVAIPNEWMMFSWTVPGDTGGNWTPINGTGGYLSIGYSGGRGSGPAVYDTWTDTDGFGPGQTDISTVSGATVQVVAKWEAGPAPTIFAPPDPSVELLRAQRRYRKTFPVGVVPAQNAGVAGCLVAVGSSTTAGSLGARWSFDPPMLRVPAIETKNPSALNDNWRNVTGAADAVVLVDPATSISAGGVYIGEQTTAIVVGSKYLIHAVADASLE